LGVRVKGFTLIELLVVIVIIVGLATGIIVLIVGIIDNAKRDKTHAVVQAVTAGCKAYYSEFHEWPPTTTYSGSANLHFYLGREFTHKIQSSGGSGSAAGLAVTKVHRPFVEFRRDWLLGASNVDPNPPVQLCDAWNRPLTYEILTVNGIKQVKIVSGGANQIIGDEDDISSEVRPN
jgi:prepilin-type N-terminal cleavage/methylation domain-containing protein